VGSVEGVGVGSTVTMGALGDTEGDGAEEGETDGEADGVSVVVVSPLRPYLDASAGLTATTLSRAA
jgi:hypothetical protein